MQKIRQKKKLRYYIFSKCGILMNMNKQKHLRIRITESQLKNLIDNIILTEEKSKSEFIRKAINEKIEKSNQDGTSKVKRN